jgi:hypothetical protein
MDSRTRRSPRAEVRHLEQVADAGESNETPLIIGAETFVVVLVVLLVVLGLSLLAYYLA